MTRRVALLPLLAMLHLALLVVVLDGAVVAAPVPDQRSIASYAVPSAITLPVEPRLTEISVPLEVAAPSFESAGSGADSSGPDQCALTETIRTALVDDAALRPALAFIPLSARTVANALMIWDSKWSTLPPRQGGVGLTRIRRIVIASVRAAPVACQSEPLTGPRLIIVPDGTGMIVLAFGSGNWAWSQVAA